MASWVWWLAGPAIATVLACLGAWIAGRPKRLPGTRRAVRDHRRFLSDLDAIAPHGADGEPAVGADVVPTSAQNVTDKLPR